MSHQSSSLSELNVTLRIIVVSPVAGVAYGVQYGKGTGYRVSMLQSSNDQNLVFEIQIPVRKSESDQPNFVGPLAQGPPAGRFVYLNIGKSAGEIGSKWDRRLKVPLAGITWSMVERAIHESKLLQARLPGKAKDGGPSCATVQPIDGWKVASH